MYHPLPNPVWKKRKRKKRSKYNALTVNCLFVCLFVLLLFFLLSFLRFDLGSVLILIWCFTLMCPPMLTKNIRGTSILLHYEYASFQWHVLPERLPWPRNPNQPSGGKPAKRHRRPVEARQRGRDTAHGVDTGRQRRMEHPLSPWTLSQTNRQQDRWRRGRRWGWLRP